jgi:hypothetical protein
MSVVEINAVSHARYILPDQSNLYLKSGDYLL